MNIKLRHKILLIIPAYNEEKSIQDTCNTILQYNKANKTNYDFVVINDGSTDKTSETCTNNKLPCINLCANTGIGGAVQTGYKYAHENNYDIAIQFDGDGQHDVAYVKNLVEPIINQQADLTIGSRFIDETSSEFKSSGARRAGIRLISFFIKLSTRKKVLDTTSGFRAANKKVIKKFACNYPPEYAEPISIVNILKNKYKIKEVPVSMNERKEGVSSIRAWKTVYYMLNVICLIIIEAVGGYKNEY